MSAELLLDNSAWARLDHAALLQDRANQIAGLLERGRIAACLPFLLQRHERQHSSQTLLRPTTATPTEPPRQVLLRPATEQSSTDPTQLLRADLGSEPH